MSNRRKVCVVGFSYTTRDAAPYDDDSFEFWGCNALYSIDTLADVKWSRWFELHNMPFLEGEHAKHYPEYLSWLNDLSIPVYMQERHESIGPSVAYPLEEIQTAMVDRWKFQERERNYLESTIAMELALAMYEGVDEVHIYGVDMVKESEYGFQRPNLEAWIMVARHQGIDVVIPEDSALMQGPLEQVYCYRMRNQLLPERYMEMLGARGDAHDKELKKCEEELERAKLRLWFQDGARQEHRWHVDRMQDLNRGVKG